MKNNLLLACGLRVPASVFSFIIIIEVQLTHNVAVFFILTLKITCNHMTPTSILATEILDIFASFPLLSSCYLIKVYFISPSTLNLRGKLDLKFLEKNYFLILTIICFTWRSLKCIAIQSNKGLQICCLKRTINIRGGKIYVPYFSFYIPPYSLYFHIFSF